MNTTRRGFFAALCGLVAPAQAATQPQLYAVQVGGFGDFTNSREWKEAVKKAMAAKPPRMPPRMDMQEIAKQLSR